MQISQVPREEGKRQLVVEPGDLLTWYLYSPGHNASCVPEPSKLQSLISLSLFSALLASYPPFLTPLTLLCLLPDFSTCPLALLEALSSLVSSSLLSLSLTF